MPVCNKTQSVRINKNKQRKLSKKHKQSGGARPAPTTSISTFEERLKQLQVSSLPSVPGTERLIKFRFKNIENIPEQIHRLIDAFQILIKDEGLAFTNDIKFFYEHAKKESKIEIRLILENLSRVKLRSIDLINTIINNYCEQTQQKKNEFLMTYVSWIWFFYDIIQYIDTTITKIFNNQLSIDE